MPPKKGTAVSKEATRGFSSSFKNSIVKHRSLKTSSRLGKIFHGQDFSIKEVKVDWDPLGVNKKPKEEEKKEINQEDISNDELSSS